MIVQNSKYSVRSWLIFIGVVWFYPAFAQTKNQSQEIVLHDEQLAIKPAGFYIERVNDEREDETAVAWILPSKHLSNTATIPVDFQGGAINAVTKFIDNNIPKNAAYHKIVIYLKKFNALETPAANGQVEGHVTLEFSFALEADQEKNVPLGTYSSNTIYHRAIGDAQAIEPTLRHMLQNGLTYINNWMIKQGGSNIHLAKKVEISFNDFTEKPENDTVYYAVTRPLTWDDFQSKTPDSKYDALVFASIGYAEEVKVENSIINVLLSMKVFVPKSACWAKENDRNDYSLNHEQRHFDIAKIIAERFKQKLKTESLPVRNYDGLVNMDYLDAYREMDALQKQYDDETSHGANQSVQQRWNVKIDTELKQFGVK
jgi:hypothetical protein